MNNLSSKNNPKQINYKVIYNHHRLTLPLLLFFPDDVSDVWEGLEGRQGETSVSVECLCVQVNFASCIRITKYFECQ